MKLADMHSERRARPWPGRARSPCIFQAAHHPFLPEIGRKFGNRDHTTVMHAVRKIEELCLDAGFSEDVELLRRMLEG
jgi:chromosomal replication initiator protein